MGFALGDIARTEEDFRQACALIRRFQPDVVLPPMGEAGNVTYIIRDEDDRAKVQGLIHVEQALEVKHFLVDPDYDYQKVSGMLLHRCMEMNMRVGGATRYYFTVPASDERTIKMFRKDGAEPMDLGALRFMKRL